MKSRLNPSQREELGLIEQARYDNLLQDQETSADSASLQGGRY